MTNSIDNEDGSAITTEEFKQRFMKRYNEAEGIQRDMDLSSAIINIFNKQHITASAIVMIL